MPTLEDILSERFGYEIDPAKALRDRQRRGEGVAEPASRTTMPPFPERPNRSGPND